MGFLLLAGLVGLLLLSLAVTLELWLWHRGKAGKAIAVGVALFGGFQIYTTAYPTESFYEKEFERITGLAFPVGAIFQFKDASYPDLQGDYTSCALIKVSQPQYEHLKSKIPSGKSNLGIIGSPCMEKLEQAIGKRNMLLEFSVDDAQGEYVYWGLVHGSTEVVFHYASW